MLTVGFGKCQKVSERRAEMVSRPAWPAKAPYLPVNHALQAHIEEIALRRVIPTLTHFCDIISFSHTI